MLRRESERAAAKGAAAATSFASCGAADSARAPGQPRSVSLGDGGGGRAGGLPLRVHLALLVLVAFLPALLLGGASVWELARAHRNAAETGLAGTARALATALDRELETALRALDTLAALPALASGDTEAAYPQAAAVGRAYDGWVALLDGEMRQSFHTLVPPGAPLPIGAGDPFVARALATGETVVSDLFLGATVRRRVVAVFRPLAPGEAGAAPGERRVLLLAFGPERLSALLGRQELPPGGFAVLTDGAGAVLARSEQHERFVGQPAPGWFLAGVAGRDGGRLEGTSLAGFPVVMRFERLERAPGWTVAVTLPRDGHEAAWRGPAARFALGAALTLLLGLGLAALLARRLFRPLRALAEDAQRPGEAAAEGAADGGIREVGTLRAALARSGAALRARALAEGRAAAAEEAAGALREAARRRDLLIAELDHRVKNALAVVQSLVFLSLRATGGDPARFGREFPDRLGALARAHDLIARADWQPTDLKEVVRAALGPWLGAGGGGRVEVAPGPPVGVSPARAQTLVLALHELATNAVKHGALSVPGGRVRLSHTAGPAGGEAVLEWAEEGGPPLPAPRPEREGFGTRLLEQGLARELGEDGRVTLRFDPAGLRATIRLPPDEETPPPDARGP